MGTISGGVFDGSSVVGWSGWSDSNHFGRPTATYPESAAPRRAPPLLRGRSAGFSSSARARSIWSLGVRRHGGRGHRLTLAASDSWVWPPRTLRRIPSSFQWIKEALLSVVTAVIPVLLPLREVVPELAYLHREERVHSKIQPVPYDLCTHSN